MIVEADIARRSRLRVGTTLKAKYRLDRLVGVGGMGSVYPRVGAMAPNATSYFAISFVDDDANEYAGARAASFNTGMNGFEHRLYSPVLGTTIGYASGPGRYGSVFVLGSGRAQISVLDQYGTSTGDGPFYFEGSDVYIDTTQTDMIDAAGANSRLALAWTSGKDIAMTLISLTDGKRVKAVVVSDEKTTTKSRPRALYDAATKTIGVSWIENGRLMFRRFAALDLTPMDAKASILDVVNANVTSYGFAQGTTSKEWSFAFLSPTNRHQIVRRLSCTM